jgi:large subunit ribosomal protein L22
MSVQAVATSVKISPRKAGLVESLVRGRTVADALVILEHTPKKGALIISKVIKSAKANAVHNHNFKEDTLSISEISIGSGLVMKRMEPAAFGRARPFKRRTSNIRVVVDGQTKAIPPAKKTATKAKRVSPKDKDKS